ncbi:hypothetical protein F4777DRAFT_578970 [Nemania sp. FL0916]|nr:hypothetical protein F4777DRAFT_578970 [Nemania sp. FL0916]
MSIRPDRTIYALRAATRARAMQSQRRTFITASSLRAGSGGQDSTGSVSGSTKRALSSSMEKAASEGEPAEGSSAGEQSGTTSETGEDTASKTGTAQGGEALKGPQGKHAPPQPKILNQSTNSVKSGLTEEQKREVERHNQEFEQRHDRAKPAARDQVDKKFWSGEGGGQDWNA